MKNQFRLPPPPACAGSSWKPISTAPKDGTRIVALDLQNGPIVISWMETENYRGGDAIFADASGGWFDHPTGNRVFPVGWAPIPACRLFTVGMVSDFLGEGVADQLGVIVSVLPYLGDAFDLRVACTVVATGNPRLRLSGHALYMRVRRYCNSGDILDLLDRRSASKLREVQEEWVTYEPDNQESQEFPVANGTSATLPKFTRSQP